MTIREAIEKELDLVIKTTQDNLIKTGKNVTGKTAQSMRKEVKDDGPKIVGTVYVPKYFKVVETGRRPTPDKKPSREMLDNIREWANAKGLTKGAEWAIATTINKEGTKLWKEGGREDIFTPATDENAAQSMSERVGSVAVKVFSQSIAKAYASY